MLNETTATDYADQGRSHAHRVFFYENGLEARCNELRIRRNCLKHFGRSRFNNLDRCNTDHLMRDQQVLNRAAPQSEVPALAAAAARQQVAIPRKS